MNPTDELIHSLRRIARGEVSGEVRIASVTAAQRRNASVVWERLSNTPLSEVIALTENQGGQTRGYFMVGKDTLADSETWVLG